MAFGEVKLVPGMDLEQTPTLNQVSLVGGNLVRWREGLIEKIGGWVRFYPFSIGSIIRDLHAWQDINSVDWLAVGATKSWQVLSEGVLRNITPQTTTTNTPPNFIFTNASSVVTIDDANINGPTTNNYVFLATPVWGGGLVLQGLYKITSVLSSTSYQIDAGAPATLSTTSSTVTITNANPGVVTWTAHGLSAGMPVFFTTTGALPTALTPGKTYYVSTVVDTDNFEVSEFPGGTSIDTTAGVQTGVQTATANGGSVPVFTTTLGNALVNVYEMDHDLILGESVSFLVPTTVGGITVGGAYLVQQVVDADNFSIGVSAAATSASSAAMNSGDVRFIYYIAIGPQTQSKPYGAGLYGADAYGTGSSNTPSSGTPITADDWTEGNWGEILLGCPEDGGIYQWSPDSGFQNGQLIANAPILNAGMFVAMPLQIVVAFGSSFTGVPAPLDVNWSTSGDFTVWAPAVGNSAGGYVIPTGSRIIGGIQAPQQGLIWTDIDLYSMQYVGGTNVFGFTQIMTGCGLIGSHAMGVLGTTVYWMGQDQFFMLPAGGAPQPLPCSVWDYIFQNLDTENAWKIRCKPNSNFNTIGWEFPSIAGDGENDSYVEFNREAGVWSIGAYPNEGRSAWIDQSLFGPPLAGTPSGLLFQHEIGYNGDGAALNPTFTSGYFAVAQGEDYWFIDQFIPDFKYGIYSGAKNAQIQVTLSVVNYPNDVPIVKGPYTVSQASNYISTRLRGRQVAITVESFDLNSFWRLGLIRYRYSTSGRR